MANGLSSTPSYLPSYNQSWMQCVDKPVGAILAGWRYDISGIPVEMRSDYVQHFEECAYCRSKQRLHRSIDFGLLVLTTASGMLFLLAFLAVRHFHPNRAVIMELVAAGGAVASALVWIAVCMTTPVPVMAFGAVKTKAREVHGRLPEEIRQRIPEQIAARILE
jgi:hypothetical protein